MARTSRRDAQARDAALVAHGDLERGRGFLVAWIERDPRDAEPLVHAVPRQISTSPSSTGTACRQAATRLANITRGRRSVAAAMRAAMAATDAGRPGDAAPVLETVHQAQPGVEALRDELARGLRRRRRASPARGLLQADADHGTDPAMRYANYRRAAEEPRSTTCKIRRGRADSGARALECSPRITPRRCRRRRARSKSNQLEDAGRPLEAAIAARKKKPHARRLRAVLQQRMGRVSAMLGDKDCAQLDWLKKAFRT